MSAYHYITMTRLSFLHQIEIHVNFQHERNMKQEAFEYHLNHVTRQYDFLNGNLCSIGYAIEFERILLLKPRFISRAK